MACDFMQIAKIRKVTNCYGYQDLVLHLFPRQLGGLNDFFLLLSWIVES